MSRSLPSLASVSSMTRSAEEAAFAWAERLRQIPDKVRTLPFVQGCAAPETELCSAADTVQLCVAECIFWQAWQLQVLTPEPHAGDVPV